MREWNLDNDGIAETKDSNADKQQAAPIAHADTNDGRFLAALTSEGITDHISPQHAIEAGHTVCQKLNAGQTPTQVANDVLNSSAMPAYQSGYFVGASIKEYCPQHMP